MLVLPQLSSCKELSVFVFADHTETPLGLCWAEKYNNSNVVGEIRSLDVCSPSHGWMEELQHGE